MVYLTIEDRTNLVKLLKGAAKYGYLRRLDLREVNDWIDKVEYPIRIPIEVDNIIGVGRNPVVKSVFGNFINKGLTNYITMAMKAG